MLAAARAGRNRDLLHAAMSLAGRCAAYAGALASDVHSTTQAAVR
jgi:hypothetical protein